MSLIKRLKEVESSAITRRLEKENKALKASLRDALEKLDKESAAAAFASNLSSSKVQVPDWTRKPSKAGHQAIPVLLASDFHLDEWVDKGQTMGRNEYNRAIAERRIRKLFERTCVVTRDYIKGISYPGITVAFLGDIFSGSIHEELRISNEDTILGSITHWLEPVSGGLKLLADEFGKVRVLGVVGNHGRNTIKPIAKNRVRDNFDWFFYQMLKRGFAGDKRFTWEISEAHKLPFTVYNTRFIASHGDEARGGSGIAGLLSPLMIAAARMSKIYEFDYWLIGHWHRLSAFHNVRVNGSVVGWNEYAAIQNFGFEPPQQDLFLVTPEHGITASWPIFV